STICVHEMTWVGGSGNAQQSSYYCEICESAGLNDTGNPDKSLGLPNNTFSNPPGWGATIGALAGSRIGMPEFGTFASHAIENFDWSWYRRYREIAETIEREYSGGLP
ncbi:TPA: hypothetical protein ACRHJ1_RS09830, partial [Neisseria meningitidis]|nr:hypothetical protein [Klebsiella pneumoniae]